MVRIVFGGIVEHDSRRGGYLNVSFDPQRVATVLRTGTDREKHEALRTIATQPTQRALPVNEIVTVLQQEAVTGKTEILADFKAITSADLRAVALDALSEIALHRPDALIRSGALPRLAEIQKQLSAEEKFQALSVLGAVSDEVPRATLHRVYLPTIRQYVPGRTDRVGLLATEILAGAYACYPNDKRVGHLLRQARYHDDGAVRIVTVTALGMPLAEDHVGSQPLAPFLEIDESDEDVLQSSASGYDPPEVGSFDHEDASATSTSKDGELDAGLMQSSQRRTADRRPASDSGSLDHRERNDSSAGAHHTLPQVDPIQGDEGTLQLRQAQAIAAAKALDGDDTAFRIGKEILETLLSSDRVVVRALIPVAIGTALPNVESDRATDAQLLLLGHLVDDGPTIRYETLRAVESYLTDATERTDLQRALLTGDGTDPERHLGVLVRHVIETFDGSDRRSYDLALGVYGTYGDRLHKERDSAEEALQERIAETAVSEHEDHQLRGKAQYLQQHLFDDTSFDAERSDPDPLFQQSDPTDQSESASSENGSAPVSETAHAGSPEAIRSGYESATSVDESRAQVEAVEECFEAADNQLDREEVLALWEVVSDATHHESPAVRRAVPGAIRAAIVNHPGIGWDTASYHIDVTIDDDASSVRAQAMKTIATLLRAGVVEWSDLGIYGQVTEALRDDQLTGVAPDATPSRADLLFVEQTHHVLRAALYESDLRWSDVVPLLHQTFRSRIDLVRRAALTVVQKGLQAGVADWDAVGRFLREAASDSRVLATAAMETVRTGLVTGSLTWTQIEPTVQATFQSSDTDVCRRALVVVGHGLQADAISWSAAEPFLTSALENEEQELALEATRALQAAFRHDSVRWEDVHDIIWHGFWIQDEDVAESILLVVSAAVEASVATWEDVAPLLNEAIDRAPPVLTLTTLDTVEAGLGTSFQWIEVEPALRRARASGSIRVVRRVHSVAATALAADIDDAAVVAFLREGVESDGVPGSPSAMAAIADVLEERQLDWGLIEPVLSAAMDHSDEQTREGAIEAACQGFTTDAISRQWVETTLTAGLNDASTAVARRTVDVHWLLLNSDRFQWDDAVDHLSTALEHPDEEVTTAALELLREGVQRELLEWEQVQNLACLGLKRPPNVAIEAIRLFGVAINQQESIDIGSFLDTALEVDDNAVTHELCQALTLGTMTGTLAWSTVEPVLREAIAVDDPQIHDQVARASLVGVGEEGYDWASVETVVRTLVETGTAQTQVTVLQYLAGLVNQATVTWADLSATLWWVLEECDDEVVTNGVFVVGILLSRGPPYPDGCEEYLREAVNVADVGDAVVEVLQTELGNQTIPLSIACSVLRVVVADGAPSAVVDGLKAIRTAVGDYELDWPEIERLLWDVLRTERAELVTEAVGIVVSGLGHEQLEWEQVGEFLEATFESGVNEADTIVLRAIEAGIDTESIRWERVHEILRDALGHPDASALAVTLIREAMQTYDLEWSSVGTTIKDALEVHDLGGAVVVTRIGLVEGNFTWDEVAPIIRQGLVHDDAGIARAAVEALGHGLAAQAIPWSAGQRLLIETIETGEASVAAKATAAAAYGVKERDLAWDDVESCIEAALERPEDDVGNSVTSATKLLTLKYDPEWHAVAPIVRECLRQRSADIALGAVETVGAGLQVGTFEWYEVRPLLREALNHDECRVTKEVTRAVIVSLRDGPLEWDDVEPILWAGLGHQHEQTAVRMVYAASIAIRHGAVDWENLESFIEANVAPDQPSSVRKRAIETIAVGLRTETFRWDEVVPVLRTVRDAENAAVAEKGVNAVRRTISTDMAAWTQVRSFLAETISSTPGRPAHEAVQTIGAAVESGAVEWDAIAGLLRSARTHPDSEVELETVKVVNTGLSEGTLAWYDVEPFVSDALNSEYDPVAMTAAESLRYAIVSGWPNRDDARAFLERTAQDDRAPVATAAMGVLEIGLPAGYFDATIATTVIASTVEDGAEPATIVGLSALEQGLDEQQIGWTNALSLLRSAIDRRSPAVTKRAFETIALGVLESKIEFGTVHSILRDAIDDNNDEAVKHGLRLLREALSTGLLEWQDAEAIVDDAVDCDSAPVLEELLRLADGVIRSDEVQTPWTDLEPLIMTVLAACPDPPDAAAFGIVSGLRKTAYSPVDAVAIVETLLETFEAGVRDALIREALSDRAVIRDDTEARALYDQLLGDDDLGVQVAVLDAAEQRFAPSDQRYAHLLVKVASDRELATGARVVAFSRLVDVPTTVLPNADLVTAIEQGVNTADRDLRQAALGVAAVTYTDIDRPLQRTLLETVLNRFLDPDAELAVQIETGQTIVDLATADRDRIVRILRHRRNARRRIEAFLGAVPELDPSIKVPMVGLLTRLAAASGTSPAVPDGY